MADRSTVLALVTSDFEDPTNWNKLSLVNSTYKWTASASGTNEYYLELAGGGDPGISQPDNVYESGSAIRGLLTGASVRRSSYRPTAAQRPCQRTRRSATVDREVETVMNARVMSLPLPARRS